MESLNKASGSHIEENYFLFDHADEITSKIKEVMGVDLTRKYLKLVDIKKMLGDTKRTLN